MDKRENISQNVCTDAQKDDIIGTARINVMYDDGSKLTIENAVFSQIKDGVVEIHENKYSYFVSLSKVRFVEAEYC